MPDRSIEGIQVILCLFLVLFLGVADNQVISPLLPAIRTELARSSHEMGFLFTGYSLSAGLSVLLWGPLSDIFGRKRGLEGGLILLSIGSTISYLAIGFSTLVVGRVVTGMGASMLSLNTISYAADYFAYPERGRAMGSIFSSYFAALILGVPLGSLLGDLLGWKAVFGVSASMSLLLLMTLHWLLPPIAGHDRMQWTGHTVGRQLQTYSGFFRSRGELGALLSSFMASAGTMGFLAFVGVWLHDDFGITGRRVGLIFLVSGATALFASPFAGALSDRVGKRFQFIASNLALALLLLLLPNLGWGLSLFAVFCGISLSAAFRQGPMEALITEVVPVGRRGSFVALRNAFSQLGIGLAALLCGLVFESRGYSAVSVLCSGFTLLAATLMLVMVRHRQL